MVSRKIQLHVFSYAIKTSYGDGKKESVVAANGGNNLGKEEKVKALVKRHDELLFRC